jgi:hypothetical protein
MEDGGSKLRSQTSAIGTAILYPRFSILDGTFLFSRRAKLRRVFDLLDSADA